MRQSFFSARIGLAFVCISANAVAAIPSRTDSGNTIRWESSKINFAGNPSNRSGIDSASFFSAVTRGLQRWQSASQGSVSFDYWQGSDRSQYESNSSYNGQSSIYFVSNADGKSLPSNVLGLTQVWYDTKSGRILEADIALNDVGFRFSTNPSDTTGSGNGGSSGRAFLENVLTHELGHAFGLSHGGGLQTTMFFVEAPEQAHLGCDDQAGVRNLYQGVFGGGRGQISGRIALETSGQSVSGAEVFALSLANGTLSHSSITVQDGRFEIGQLDPGNYAIWIAPYLPGASALPPYYSGIQPKVCPGGVAFSRDLDATIRNVRSGSSVDVGTLNVRCGGPAPVRASTSLDASPGSFAIHDRMDSSSRDYRVSIPGGDLKVHALGYSLFSPVALSVSVLDSRGTSVSGARLSPVYTSSRSGFSNYDGATWVKDLPAGEYIIRVSRQFLGSQYYPGGMIALDSVPFIALVGEVLPARAATTEMSDQIQMSQSSRCVMNESFAAYQSPGGLPPRSQITEESRDESKGFCGSIRASGGAVPPQTGLQIMAWLLPWGFCLALTRLLLVKRALQA